MTGPQAASDPFPSAIVIYGASGDLTRRKLIVALFHLECDGMLDECFQIVGFARTEGDDKWFRKEMKEALAEAGYPKLGRDAAWRRFSSRLHYVTGRYDDVNAHKELHRRLNSFKGGSCDQRYLYYFALPPSASESVLRCMQTAGYSSKGMAENGARVLIEKPFGVDLDSAKRMNQLLHAVFDEPQIYRIDHYLAKDTIRNLLVFRFGNAIFEPLWNRRYIDSVQITAAESLGVEGRGGYYEEAGVVRDMVQNHVMQVMGLIAMEPPVAGDIESVRDKREETFKALGPLQNEDFVFGQYEGYRKERNVAPDSATPTYVALRLYIHNWRWQGVPFYIRSGKYLAKKLTQVVIQFKTVPLCVFGDDRLCAQVLPNVLLIRIQPDESIRLRFSALHQGREDSIGPADMNFKYENFGHIQTEAYERVVLDAINRRPGLFWRADGIEAAWKVVSPMIDVRSRDRAKAFPNYKPGSWGPAEADELLRADGRYWQK